MPGQPERLEALCYLVFRLSSQCQKIDKQKMVSGKRSVIPKDINRNEVQRLVANGAQLVEVLPAEEYNEAHLPGAINLPLKKLDRQSAKQLDLTRPVITYCNDFQ